MTRIKLVILQHHIRVLCKSFCFWDLTLKFLALFGVDCCDPFFFYIREYIAQSRWEISEFLDLLQSVEFTGNMALQHLLNSVSYSFRIKKKS